MNGGHFSGGDTLYFTIRRIMRESTVMADVSNVMAKYGATFLKTQAKAPKWTWQEVEHTEDPEHSNTKWEGSRRLRNLQGDFKKFIHKISDGLTRNGLLLLNQSIEAYVYSILGEQAKTKQSISGSRASALETQKVFCKIVEDSVINYDTTTWINNMNKSVTDTASGCLALYLAIAFRHDHIEEPYSWLRQQTEGGER